MTLMDAVYKVLPVFGVLGFASVLAAAAIWNIHLFIEEAKAARGLCMLPFTVFFWFASFAALVWFKG